MNTLLSDRPATSRRSDDQLLGDFTQVLTHRIRNLLAGIEGFTDLLTDTLGSQEQRELALRILESTARIEFVLTDLQHFSRPLQMMARPVPVYAVVDRLQAALDEQDLHRIVFTLDHPDHTILADPILLHQALLMLFQNALEACAPHHSVRLHVALDERKKVMCFNVWNSGTISLDRAATKVFEPFFTTKPDSLGIGLSMVQRIARAHGGSVLLATNDPARGICFTVKIPCFLGEYAEEGE